MLKGKSVTTRSKIVVGIRQVHQARENVCLSLSAGTDVQLVLCAGKRESVAKRGKHFPPFPFSLFRVESKAFRSYHRASLSFRRLKQTKKQTYW